MSVNRLLHTKSILGMCNHIWVFLNVHFVRRKLGRTWLAIWRAVVRKWRDSVWFVRREWGEWREWRIMNARHKALHKLSCLWKLNSSKFFAILKNWKKGWIKLIKKRQRKKLTKMLIIAPLSSKQLIDIWNPQIKKLKISTSPSHKIAPTPTYRKCNINYRGSSSIKQIKQNLRHRTNMLLWKKNPSAILSTLTISMPPKMMLSLLTTMMKQLTW